MLVDGGGTDNAASSSIGAGNVWMLPNASDGGDSVCAVTGWRGAKRTLTWVMPSAGRETANGHTSWRSISRLPPVPPLPEIPIAPK